MMTQNLKTRETVRIDQYLWAIRIFRTRSLAAQMCRAGHIDINGSTVKPAHPVRIGDRITVNRSPGVREIEVKALLSKRVGAEVATASYVDNSPPVPERSGVTAPFVRDPASGRPTKRDRRRLDRLRRAR